MEVRISTKILVIEGDHANFQVRKCIAQALGLLPSVDLIHAPDVAKGLQVLEQKKPDAIIFSEEDISERDLLLESLDDSHPPLVLQTEDSEYYKTKQNPDQKVMYVPIYDTLDGMHQVLMLAASLGQKSRSPGTRQKIR